MVSLSSILILLHFVSDFKAMLKQYDQILRYFITLTTF